MVKEKSKKMVLRAGKYTIVGATVTLFNFVVYTIIAHAIVRNNDFLWIDSIVAYVMSAVLAYVLHSRITWKERKPGKYGVAKFFAWNLVGAVLISPVLTIFFGFWEPVYQFVFGVTSAMHLPLSYEFIESTGIFCFTTLITMILNYLFYDRLVFGV